MEGKTIIQAAPVEITPVKPGIKTTEFGATATTVGLQVLGVVTGMLPPWIAAIVSGAVTIAYTVSRTWEKVKAARP